MSFLYLMADFVCVMFYFSMVNFLHVSYVPDGGRCEHLSIRTDRQDNNGRRDDQEICQEKKSDVMGFIVSSDFIIQFYQHLMETGLFILTLFFRYNYICY